jgi:dTDP-glucose pyrophosphorylase
MVENPVKPTLLVLAAGMGSRYGGLKQIDPVGPAGETIIDYSIYDAVRAGFGRLVFVIRRDIEQPFREIVGRKFEDQLPVEYVFQELDKLPAPFRPPEGRTKPWGTSHAILMAEETIREPFAVINADDFYGATSFRILGDRLRAARGTDYAMVGFVLRNTLSEHGSVARGVCACDEAGWLKSVTEMTDIATGDVGAGRRLSGEEIVSMNMWGFTPALFGQLRGLLVEFLREQAGNAKAEFYIPTAINALIQSGRARLQVLRTTDHWFGVTYKEDRARVVAGVRDLVTRGGYPPRLWA